jgi:hypothetical protein
MIHFKGMTWMAQNDDYMPFIYASPSEMLPLLLLLL